MAKKHSRLFNDLIELIDTEAEFYVDGKINGKEVQRNLPIDCLERQSIGNWVASGMPSSFIYSPQFSRISRIFRVCQEEGVHTMKHYRNLNGCVTRMHRVIYEAYDKGYAQGKKDYERPGAE